MPYFCYFITFHCNLSTSSLIDINSIERDDEEGKTKTKAKKKDKSKIKYTCNICDTNVWGKQDLNLMRIDCQGLMWSEEN